MSESLKLDASKYAHQVHRLGDQPTGHPDIDRSLLSVSRQYPHLDTGRLEGMDSIGHSLLQLILDGRGPK